MFRFASASSLRNGSNLWFPSKRILQNKKTNTFVSVFHFVELRGFEPRSREGRKRSFYMLSLLLLFEYSQGKDTRNSILSVKFNSRITELQKRFLRSDTAGSTAARQSSGAMTTLPILSGRGESRLGLDYAAMA